MFFNNLSEEIGTVPEYMISDIMVNNQQIKPVPDSRPVLGQGNSIQGYAKMSTELQRALTQISAYIISQHIPLLKNMVVYESLLTSLPAGRSELNMPTRYLCRVGELVIVPLCGSVSMHSAEFPGGNHIMTPGQLYRVNNRVNSCFESSEDFVACCFNFLDFDLRRYLMPHDVNSPFARHPDEIVTPSLTANSERPADVY